MQDDPLFPPAAPDFSDPLGLLKACHGRILNHCDTLERLPGHVREKGLDTEARQAIARVHRYFSSAAKQHHEDEEQDLFPRLARQSLKLAEAIHRLKLQHAAMAGEWEQLRPMLELPTRISDDPDGFAALVARFTGLYREHIEREEEEVLEPARHSLSGADLRKLGFAMAERRGQPPPSF